MNLESDSWALQEFAGINLGDKRLNKRLLKLAEDFSKHPEFSINQASKDWHDAKAAYRFFQNDQFTEKDVLNPHFKNSANRCKHHDYILIAQDTCVIGYSHHPKTKGLGSIGGYSDRNKNVHGLYMHTALAMTAQGMPLGLLSNSLWARKEIRDKSKKRTDHLIHTEDKETYKWINALEECHEALEGKIKSITICDRECDVFDFYLSAQDMGTDVVVRCRDGCQVGTREIPIKLSEKLSKTKSYSSSVKIKIPIEPLGNKNNKKGTKFRTAELEITSSPITLTPSRKQTQVVKEKINLFAVEAREINPPEGLETAHWVLLTTLKVESFEESLLVINCYSLRWKIENYFRILKSGCTIEQCRLGEGERLKKYIALSSIIAWRIFWMTFIRRVDPQAICEVALTKNEWQTLFCYFNNQTKLPDIVPSIDQAVIWLTRLGGFLARKNDGNPGPTYLWRGWSRLQDMANMRNILINS